VCTRSRDRIRAYLDGAAPVLDTGSRVGDVSSRSIRISASRQVIIMVGPS
jgi:hypothetical protein